jgi:hypothetical protein
MTDTRWTADDVQGFTARLADFYSDLTPAQKQIFADMLEDDVRGSDEVAGYLQSDEPLPSSVITTAVADYLMEHAEA